MNYKINGLDVKKGVTFITYIRKPTKAEIKFGYGAMCYRDFNIEDCFTDDGILKLKMRVTNNKLLYFYSGIEYKTAKKSQCYKTIVK